VSACVLCWWGVLALVPAGVCFGRDLGLFVGRRAGGGSGGGAGKDALFVELWKACAGPLASVPPLGEKVYYFPQGHIEQVSAQPPGGRALFPLMVVVLFRRVVAFFKGFGFGSSRRGRARPNPHRISRGSA
jgi:hypothetical protein